MIYWIIHFYCDFWSEVSVVSPIAFVMTKAVLAMTDRRIKTLLEITELSRKIPKLARFERVGTNDSTASKQGTKFIASDK